MISEWLHVIATLYLKNEQIEDDNVLTNVYVNTSS